MNEQNADSSKVESTTSDGIQGADDTQDFSGLSDEELSSRLSTKPEPQTVTEPVKAPSETEEPSNANAEKQHEESPKTLDAPDPQKLAAENEVLRKRLQDKELLQGRQARELGELRKRLQAEIEAKKQGLDERFATDPAKAVKDELDIRERERALQEVSVRERALQTRQVVEAHVELTDEVRQAIAESLQRDRIDDQFINEFIVDPFSRGSPETIIQLAKRAQAERHAIELLAICQEQNKEIERLKSGSQDAVKKVAQALKKPPEMTNSSAGATSSGKVAFTEDQISSLSDAQLAELLKG